MKAKQNGTILFILKYLTNELSFNYDNFYLTFK